MKKFFLFFFFPMLLFALEKQPWFSDVYEFHFLGAYAYSRFRKVQGANPQLTSASNDQLLHFALECSVNPEWSIDGDIEFVDTPRQSFGFRSTAFQGRYLWLDDIVGDPISLDTGINVRVVSGRSLRDVSCPYHGNAEFQLNFSLGKEFDYFRFWRYRIWGFGQAGIANKGSPWIEGVFSVEGNYDDLHKWALTLTGGHGYGRIQRNLNVNDFYGYGRVRYKFVDIGARYGRRLGVWGTIRFEYIRRVFARLYPENVNTFMISYLLPFSF